jgi:hypothetical protein
MLRRGLGSYIVATIGDIYNDLMDEYSHDDLGYSNRFRWPFRASFQWQFLQTVEDIFTADKFTKHGVFLIQIGSRFEGQVKLRPSKSELSFAVVRHRCRTCPLVPGPLFAMARTPRLSCLAAPFISCSSRNGVPQYDSPPAPVPVGSPDWIYESARN